MDDVLFSGWLLKKKHRGKSIFAPDKRFFVLEGHSLKWYEKFQATTNAHPLNSIDLRSFRLSLHDTNICLTPISSVAGFKSYDLVADSTGSAQTWYDKLMPFTVDGAALLHRRSFWDEVDDCLDEPVGIAEEGTPQSDFNDLQMHFPSVSASRRSSTEVEPDLKSDSDAEEDDIRMELVVALKAKNIVLPNDLDSWSVSDLHDLSQIGDALPFWFTSHSNPRRSSTRHLSDEGAVALRVVRKVFGAHGTIEPRLVYFASQYVTFTKTNAALFANHMLVWTKEATTAQQAGRPASEIKALQDKIKSAEKEVSHAEADVQFHDEVLLTVKHILSAVGKFNDHEEGFVRCFLSWLFSPDEFRSLRALTKTQSDTVSTLLNTLDKDVAEKAPQLLELQNSITQTNIASHFGVGECSWHQVLQNANLKPDDIETILSDSFTAGEMGEIFCAAKSENNGSWEHELVTLKLILTVAHGLAPLLATSMLAITNEVAPATSDPSSDLDVIKVSVMSDELLKSVVIDSNPANILDILQCEIITRSANEVANIAEAISQRYQIVKIANAFVPSVDSTQRELAMWIVFAEPSRPSRALVCKIRITTSECERLHRHANLYQELLSCTTNEQCARKFAGIPENVNTMSWLSTQKHTAVLMKVWMARGSKPLSSSTATARATEPPPTIPE